MARKKKEVKQKEPVRIRFKELSNGNKSIYLDIYRNGKRTYEFLKLYLVPEIDQASKALNEHNMILAQKVKADRIIELTNSEKGISNATLRSKMTLQSLLDRYAQFLKEGGHGSSIRGVNSVKKTTKMFHGENTTLRQIDKDYCKDFIHYLQNDYRGVNGQVIAPHTVCGYLTVFSAALNWGVRNDFIGENPFSKLSPQDRPKKPESQREYLQIDEIKTLIATKCPTREDVKQAFLFSCYCGLRYSDIISLRWCDIHKDGEVSRIEIVMKKTKEPIYIPLSEQALKWLPKRPKTAKDEDKIFDLPSVSRVCLIIDAWAKKAGIKKHITFHVARHSFATMMLTLDVDLYTTSKLLGHKDVTTTQIYAKIIDQKKTDAVNRVNDIFKDK
jgi:Site-specific recombinase XerD